MNSLGFDCMIANKVRIRNISGHTFIPLKDLAHNNITHEINLHTYGGSLMIEPHVWIGECASIFTPFDCRIGFDAIVKFESRSCGSS